ncbi:hypothetical protein [Zobellia uliginosa]|nr:hypothetical protein [Zobellia uliginosa]
MKKVEKAATTYHILFNVTFFIGNGTGLLFASGAESAKNKISVPK